MRNPLTIRIKNRTIKSTVVLPASKSISARLLLLNKLSDGKISFHNLSSSDDAKLMERHLDLIENCDASAVPTMIDAKNSGAVMRFLTAYLSVTPGTWLITGSSRLKERPVGQLVDALQLLGADIQYVENDGYCPVLIHGKKLKGGKVSLDTSQSSQHVTALLLVANELENGIEIDLKSRISSLPFINLTISILQKAGGEVEMDQGMIRVVPTPYKKTCIDIENDWPSTSFWFEIAALSEKAEVKLPGLYQDSLQGESILPELFAWLGIKTEYQEEGILIRKTGRPRASLQVNFRDHIDLALPYIVTSVILQREAEFTGLENLKIKESDRFGDLLQILSSMNASYETDGQSWIRIKPGELSPPGIIDCQNDHRFVMSVAPLALVFDVIEISNYADVDKSYPGFWNDIREAGFDLKDND